MRKSLITKHDQNVVILPPSSNYYYNHSTHCVRKEEWGKIYNFYAFQKSNQQTPPSSSTATAVKIYTQQHNHIKFYCNIKTLKQFVMTFSWKFHYKRPMSRKQFVGHSEALITNFTSLKIVFILYLFIILLLFTHPEGSDQMLSSPFCFVSAFKRY